ncbi:cysteine-rich CWC family protein [Candidatus Nitronereus thalassa]|uniref:cysteine-rich CWC family protein n=1 Tax=Candidatus Nitronereus thalassa TaxID=3020898 RepID=UPI003B968CC1
MKACERCGQTFSCGPVYSCWCYERILADGKREMVSSQFQDCLCQTCLDQISQSA